MARPRRGIGSGALGGTRAPLTISRKDRLSGKTPLPTATDRRRAAPSKKAPRRHRCRLGYSVRPPVGTTNSARPVTLMGVSRRAGLYSGSAAAQAVDEIGEADLTGAAEALGGDNRLNLRNARVEIAVDDDVIVFRPVAHFFGGFRHARGDGGGTVLGAGAQARFERGHVGRQDKHGHEIAQHAFGELVGSLAIDVGGDVAAGGDRLA